MSSPVERFFAFMRERESIRLNKEAGKPWPWTKDKILQTYSFTNVKREHDRTSRLLIENLYKPNYDTPREQLLLNCALARYFGTAEFMQAIGWQESFRPKWLMNKVKELNEKDKVVWTGAYIIPSGGRVGPKEDTVVGEFITALMRRSVLWETKWTHWKAFIEALQTVPGFGGSGFMAKEVTLDTRYTSFWPKPPEDVNTWTPVGPGSMRGAYRVQGKKSETGKERLSKNETLEVCRMLFQVHELHWHGLELELHDIQFQLCEFDKYERVRLHQGRPKATYTPYENTQGSLL